MRELLDTPAVAAKPARECERCHVAPVHGTVWHLWWCPLNNLLPSIMEVFGVKSL